MTGVPGGDVDVTLHAAITETLAKHSAWAASNGGNTLQVACRCDHVFRALMENADHQTERVLAVLADRLPHTPPDQLATLIGGDWETAYSDPTLSRVIGPWVPDSPPAAPEPRQDGHDVSCERQLGGYPTCACDDRADSLPAAPTEEPNPHA